MPQPFAVWKPDVSSAGISGVSDAGHGAVSVCLLSVWKEDQRYEQIRSVVAGSHDEALWLE